MTDINRTYRKLSQNLTGLLAFDIVSQHGNLTGAAEALGLTQSAISQRIKSLEVELGVKLFRREHRGVTLTAEGLRLLNVVGPAMKHINTSVISLMERKSNPRVRISADFAFSTFWLLPRLSHLRSELGDEIEIQILASQVPPDEQMDDCDIKIHVLESGHMKRNDELLLQETVGAVCSPGFLERNGPFGSPQDLLGAQLLSLSKPSSAEWQTWQGWFTELGVTGSRSRNYVSFNNYDMVTQAAMAGEGVALGWLGLVDDLLDKGLLVKAVPDIVTSDAGYVMSRDFTSPREGPGRVFDWIVNRASKQFGPAGRAA